ncbi:T9SS type A sorting domain-containing protein [bacterium]|nr:T9SS type A sorting domain-containing protein [bacterium]
MKVPTEYKLSHNFPNLFNPETMIEYKLPKTLYVNLTVYNMMGQKVCMLLDRKQAAGNYQVIWNNTDKNSHIIGSGVYLVRMEVGGFSKLFKLVLVRLGFSGI